MIHKMYTVSRCKSDDTLYGPTHGSSDSLKTICGQSIDSHWWILNNTFDGDVSCKKCLSLLAKATGE